jgi:hypothetical protein
METKLIEIAYSFEQATLSRKPPCPSLCTWTRSCPTTFWNKHLQLHHISSIFSLPLWFRIYLAEL